MKKCYHPTHCHDLDELVEAMKKNGMLPSDIFLSIYNDALELRNKPEKNCDCECCLKCIKSEVEACQKQASK